MNISKNSLTLKDRDNIKSSIPTLRKKLIQNKYDKIVKLKFINLKMENSEEKENSKINSNKKEKQIKYPKAKNFKNKSNKNVYISNLSSFKYINKNKSPKKNYSSFNLENLLINTKITENKNNIIEKDDYREMFSKYVRDDYSNSILESLLSDDFSNQNFLDVHKITPRMRTRMADWMIEVLSNYNCDDLTYFESINIMDRYFKECDLKNKILEPEDLHLIGVTSMFISSKYHDIRPLRLKAVQEKIAHGKLTCEEIKNKEDEISELLNYSFGFECVR